MTMLVGAAIAGNPLATVEAAAGGFVNVDTGGVAIQGYDPVAYFSEGSAVKGDAQYSAEWQGATWHFASAANRDAFVAAPESYAPQYGGWCAFGATEGYAAETDPAEAWTIVDGKLYLNWDKDVKSQWSQDIPGHLKKSESNWPAIQTGLLDGSATIYRKE
ncbi:MAG: YHS domain-containing (seleno)protein [Dongiaceae bacterium]